MYEVLSSVVSLVIAMFQTHPYATAVVFIFAYTLGKLSRKGSTFWEAFGKMVVRKLETGPLAKEDIKDSELGAAIPLQRALDKLQPKEEKRTSTAAAVASGVVDALPMSGAAKAGIKGGVKIFRWLRKRRKARKEQS